MFHLERSVVIFATEMIRLSQRLLAISLNYRKRYTKRVQCCKRLSIVFMRLLLSSVSPHVCYKNLRGRGSFSPPHC
uniref:Secreted protein n=1 Tax=Ascaris lumbricoides TaxID=6252 RepID=A0A0M3HK62_ASCLU